MAYRAPGLIDELNAAELQAWNGFVSRIFDSQIEVARDQAQSTAPRAWIYNAIADGGGDAAEADIRWPAFPRRVSNAVGVPAAGWKMADEDRNLQEEYCEWEVVRDALGKVIRVTVTTETADYYQFLAAVNSDLLLSLYRKHVSPNVQIGDLISGGRYNPKNRWNLPQNGPNRGLIMHMAQVNNTFGAAVNLSAVATWPRVDDNGQLITGEQALINCAQFGVADRHSDPHIGSEINRFVREGGEISFADPVGLYILLGNTGTWVTPDGSDPANWRRVVRGTDDFPLRVIFEAPTGSAHKLGDVRIGGKRIQFGGQIIEELNVRIRGLARAAESPATPLTCGGRFALGVADAGDVTFAEMDGFENPSRVALANHVMSPE